MNEKMNELLNSVPVFVVLLFFLVIAILFVWSFVWMYKDAQLREKSGCLVVLVLLFFATWPLNIVIWLVCRPKLEDIYPEFYRQQQQNIETEE